LTQPISGLTIDTPRNRLTGTCYPEPTGEKSPDAEAEAMRFNRNWWTVNSCRGGGTSGSCCHGRPSWLLHLGPI